MNALKYQTATIFILGIASINSDVQAHNCSLDCQKAEEYSFDLSSKRGQGRRGAVVFTQEDKEKLAELVERMTAPHNENGEAEEDSESEVPDVLHPSF